MCIRDSFNTVHRNLISLAPWLVSTLLLSNIQGLTTVYKQQQTYKKKLIFSLLPSLFVNLPKVVLPILYDLFATLVMSLIFP